VDTTPSALANENFTDDLNLGETKLFCMTPIRNNIQYFSNGSAANFINNFAPLGGGSITITFDPSFPSDRRSYVTELFNTIYPEIVDVYGNPSNVITVIIKYDPTIYPWNYYDPGANTLAMSDLPPTTGINPGFDNIFTHEMIHAFHDAIYIIPENSWAEEGMAEATTEIVAMSLRDKGIRDIVYRDMIINLKYYDVWSYAGLDFLGGTEYFFNKIEADLSYRSAAAMFLILSNQLSIDPSKPYEFLGRLNDGLYERGLTYVPDSTFKNVVRDVAGGSLVEGTYADDWLGSQPITHATGKLDSFIGIFPIRPENPGKVRVYAFERYLGEYGRVEDPIPNVQINVKIKDHTSTVVEEFSIITNNQGIGEQSISSFPLPMGGYEIYTSATIDGIAKSSRSFALSQGQDLTISDKDENIYGVTLNMEGSPISSDLDVTGGTLVNMDNGGFILRAGGTSVPFEVTLKSGGHEKKIGKPNPYTRVVWTYATPIEPYSVTVNIIDLPSDHQTNLYVDSIFTKTLKGGDSDIMNFEAGVSHTVSVDQYVNSSSDSRFLCPTYVFTVSSDSVLNFTYNGEFLVIFEHNIPNTIVDIQVGEPLKGEETKNYSLPASFWWKDGSIHSFVYPNTVIDKNGLHYVLNITSVDSPVTIHSPMIIVGHYSKELAIITAYSIRRNEQISIQFTIDGLIHITPYEFIDFSGQHTIVMPSVDDAGDPFLKWSDTNSPSPTRIIDSAGIYQAVYGLAEPDFTMVIIPKAQRIAPGSSASYTIQLESLGGFDSPVTFSIAGLPFNSSGKFDPPSITPPGSVTLKINIWKAAMVGHYRFIVNGVGGGKVHSTEIDLSLGACIIATSTFGSELSPEVNLLRTFREEYVLPTFAGEQFMIVFNDWYYSFSPQLAKVISENLLIREFAKIILYPLLYALKISSYTYNFLSFNPELAIFTSGFIASALIGMFYLLPQLYLFSYLKKEKFGFRIFKVPTLIAMLFLVASATMAISAEVIRIERIMMFSSVLFVISSICLSGTLGTHVLSVHLRKFRK